MAFEQDNVVWQTCGDDNHWCSFEDLHLPIKSNVFGVYVIWHEGDPARIVDVGQGDISDRLQRHRNDKEVLYYRAYGTLRVTWTSVPEYWRDGVERYLADTLKPLVGRNWPKADPIPVNLPDYDW